MIRHLLSVVLIISTANCLKKPCNDFLAVNITDGGKEGTDIIKDGVRYNASNYYVQNGTTYGCICNIKKPCIRKCCGPNEIMAKKACVRTDANPLTFPVHEGTTRINSSLNYHFIHHQGCERHKVLLMPHYEEDAFFVQANGSLYLPNYMKQQMRSPEHFCLEMFEYEELEMSGNLSALICTFDEDVEDPTKASMTNSYGMIISMPFLLLTFLAYAFLPDRNLHMKALMMYVINLLMGYLLLVIIQLSTVTFGPTTCSLLGYFCVFFFMVSFFWMNIICIDIWFTFSGLRGFSGSKKSAERKRFFIYCAYGWGVPLLQVLIVYIIDATVSGTSPLKPGIGEGQCFLKKGYAELFYFYGPMAILITINIVLFAITAFKIRNIKKETSMLKKEDSKRHSYENDKQTFNLYLKLLFAMGVNWSMEIISWVVIWKVRDAPEYIWYLTDFCNAIYGVFIFFIFVFKKSTWKLLKKRYYSFIGKPHLAHSMTMSNTTRITSYSTNNSSIHDHPHGGANDTNALTSEA